MLDGQAHPNSYECEQCRSIVSFGAPVVVTAKGATMKLCPLFESISEPLRPSAGDASYCAGYEHGYSGALDHAQDKLPREAIEAAIGALEDIQDMCGRSLSHHIEQLRAMLPEGEG
jgi:hypothetical protein